jgi:hypothetical protein
MKPSPFRTGEGCQDWAKVNPAASGRDLNGGLSSHRHGGVSGVGMCEKELGVRGEIPAGGWQHPTAGTSGEYREADLACVEVGAVRSSEEAGNVRGAKGPHLVNANREAKDW